jgi:hypothetical protein
MTFLLANHFLSRRHLKLSILALIICKRIIEIHELPLIPDISPPEYIKQSSISKLIARLHRGHSEKKRYSEDSSGPKYVKKRSLLESTFSELFRGMSQESKVGWKDFSGCKKIDFALWRFSLKYDTKLL